MLRHVVLGWTAFTTVFLWTSTNRGLWRPAISAATVGEEGHGRTVTFWILLGLVPVALAMFYLSGRRRARPLFFTMLCTWHLGLTGLAFWMWRATSGAGTFVGGTWGWKVPLGWLAGGFLVMALAAVGLAVLELHVPRPAPRPWLAVRWRQLLLAAALTPIIAILFQAGSGYDWTARVATGLAILQWIVILLALENDGG